MTELVRLARIVAEWAAPLPIKRVYLFGSRVRGDNRPDSDLDIAVEWADDPTEAEMRAWHQENYSDFSDFKHALGVVPSIHIPGNDVVWPAIHAGAKAPVEVIGKVWCVMTLKKSD